MKALHATHTTLTCHLCGLHGHVTPKVMEINRCVKVLYRTAAFNMTHHLCWPLSAEPISISLLSLFGSAGLKGQDVFIAQQQTTLEVCAPKASLHSQPPPPPTTTGDIRVFQKYIGNKNNQCSHTLTSSLTDIPLCTNTGCEETSDAACFNHSLLPSLALHCFLLSIACQRVWKLKWQLWSCQLLANYQERTCAFWDNTSPNICTEPLTFNMCVKSWRFPTAL